MRAWRKPLNGNSQNGKWLNDGMAYMMFTDTVLYTWLILPVLIFLARVVDVSIGTARLIFVARGYKRIAPLIGFVEVLIWILAIGQIMKNLSNPICYIAYAGGFATGNYVGMLWVERLSIGRVMIQVVTKMDATHLIQSLRAKDYGCTVVDGEGVQGPVKIIFTIVPKCEQDEVITTIQEFNPKAFYTLEEVERVSEGILPSKGPTRLNPWLAYIRPFRKGK